jgi:hypothetical protein
MKATITFFSILIAIPIFVIVFIISMIGILIKYLFTGKLPEGKKNE